MALLGPPELRNPIPKLLQLKAAPSAAAVEQKASPVSARAEVEDPFVSLMVANYNKVAADPRPPMGLTENNSPTFLSTGNPCLDFFFQVVPNTPSDSLIKHLKAAWDHDPLTTLKLICNLRGVRGTGKNDRKGFYTSAVWLHSQHPKTLACNVESFAKFGYIKDLLEILSRILEASEERNYQREERKRRRNEIIINHKVGKEMVENRETELREEIKLARAKKVKEMESALREETRLARAKKVVERYSHDEDFRFLHERISDYFAQRLKRDMVLYEAGDYRDISFAAKWCPSLYTSYDQVTCICECIARKVFPKESYPEYEGIEDAHYVYRVRDRLRKQVLAPLRKALELPEVYMSANKWDLLPYNRVASLAMKVYTKTFMIHDGARFMKYLTDVRVGKAKISAGALLPHEIIKSVNHETEFALLQVAELQWNRIVDDLSKEGKLRNCMAICDVSGSMFGTPLEVSVALGLLVSELSEEPWKGKLITFSEKPELHIVEGDDLKSKTRFVSNMNWDMNTDFQKVFDLILEVAVNGSLKPEQMIKRLFVFSDMEFDEASLHPWETDYRAIVRKYTEKGYESAVPEIIFWNLRHSRSTPVPEGQEGVALVGGFSKNLIKLFLENDGVIEPQQVVEAGITKNKNKRIDPVQVMEAAISGEEYQNLVVLD